MNVHMQCDLLAYNYFYRVFNPKSKITISASCTTVHNCMQQLRHGKSYNLPHGEREYSMRIDSRQSILVKSFSARMIFQLHYAANNKWYLSIFVYEKKQI